MLPCPIGSVSNVTVSNRSRVQFYCITTVWCPILMCLIGPVSNLTVSNRFHFADFCIMCPILMCPMGWITRPNYLCVQYSCVQLVLRRMLVSNRTCESNAVVMCPIEMCPIGPVSNRSVPNWCGIQSYCVELDLCPIFLCPITYVQSVCVQSECAQLGPSRIFFTLFNFVWIENLYSGVFWTTEFKFAVKFWKLKWRSNMANKNAKSYQILMKLDTHGFPISLIMNLNTKLRNSK